MANGLVRNVERGVKKKRGKEIRGHIVKRYKDSYTIVLNLGKDPSTGKPRQQWISVKGTKKDAEKKLAELLHQLDTGNYTQPSKVTLGEYLKRWLKDYVTPNLAPKTAEWYAYIVHTHIIPALGNIMLTQLRPEHLQRYYADKLASGRNDGQGALSPQTVRHYHVTIHYALETAIKWGIIMRNPADAVMPPPIQRKQMQTWNESDQTVRVEIYTATRCKAHACFTDVKAGDTS